MDLIRCDRVDVVGKVPWKNEFVRPGAATSALSSLDAWMMDCAEVVTREPMGWDDENGHTAIHAFLWRPRQALSPGSLIELLAGAVGPSEDGAGRKYPAVVVGSLVAPAELGATPELLPLLLEEFWQRASELLSELRTSRLEVESSRLRDLQKCFGFSIDEAKVAYAQWTATFTTNELSAIMAGALRGHTPERTILDIEAAVKPFRGVETPKTPLTLRLPLGSMAGAAVCLWIDLVRRAARWHTTVPSFFWSHDGSTGTMLLHLGDPPRSTFAELWGRRRDRDEVFDLAAPVTRDHAAPLPTLDTSRTATDASEAERAEPVADLLARLG